jgi:Uma2 family endonuclease
MDTIQSTTSTPPQSLLPWTDFYRFSVDEYERMLESLEDASVELIDGYVVKKMGKKSRHVWSVGAVRESVAARLPEGWFWRKEDPVRIPDFDEPEPDLAIVRGSEDDYLTHHPEPPDIAMVAEVSETTLNRDRGEKLLACAKGQIPVYWIVNLVEDQVEVYTDPASDGYKTRLDLKRGDLIPVVIDGILVGQIPVSEVLPRNLSSPTG